jgi:hypothetical protein
MPSITEILTDTEARSASGWARARRQQQLRREFPDLAQMRVLDLGGEPHTWTGPGPRPREVTILNIPWVAEAQARALEGTPGMEWLTPVGGDACDPPEELRRSRFDLVHSNSVIEHVGGHRRRVAFAYWAQALGDHLWVQTPNRWFPIEPHWLCPGFQYLPPRGRAAVQKVWPIGSFTERRGELEQRLGDVLDIELLSASELRFYFPSARILRERVAGLAKSLIAVG